MSTSPSSAASAAIASPSRTSSTRPSTWATAPSATAAGRGRDAIRVTAGEQDAVLRRQPGRETFGERAAETLVGAL